MTESRLPVPRNVSPWPGPFWRRAYAPMRYDYMSGYIWMFILGLFGLSITFLFNRYEKKGLIRKYGVEEAATA